MKDEGGKEYKYIAIAGDSESAEVLMEIAEMAVEIQYGQIVLEVVEGKVIEIETVQRKIKW